MILFYPYLDFLSVLGEILTKEQKVDLEAKMLASSVDAFPPMTSTSTASLADSNANQGKLVFAVIIDVINLILVYLFG